MELGLLLILTLLIVCVSWLFISLVLYFVPVIIAYIRKHNHLMAITILTIFVGWTFIGWLSALLWSLSSDIKDESD